MSARPFPWASLDPVSRVEVAAGRAVRTWAASRFRPEQVARTLGTLLGARVEILVRRARPLVTARALDDGVGAVLAVGDAAPLGRGALVEAEGALAAALLARALRRAPPVVAAKTPGAGVAGGFAALVVAAARRVSADLAPRIRAAGPSAALLEDLARVDPDLLAVELTVLLDDEAFLARVVVPRGAALATPPSPWTLAALGSVTMSLPLVACASTASAADLASLRAGDAWMPGSWPLHRDESGEWAGTVLVAAPSLEIGVRADLGPGARLVLRGQVEPLAWTAPVGVRGKAMNDSNDTDALVEAVGEVPVVVRVEIGSAEMRAREWAALARGDVIALGTRVGGAVTLRAGSVEIARGELVEIEGEIGVRIVELLQNKQSKESRS